MANKRTTIALALEGDNKLTKWMGTLSEKRLEELAEILSVTSLRQAPLRNKLFVNGPQDPIDTGFLPVSGTGIIRHQRGFYEGLPYDQVTFQVEPKKWTGQFSYGSYNGRYSIVHPYLILIGDWVDNKFLGARGFYSPEPVRQHSPLYHINLPNMNCIGYCSTGVGWICFYQHRNTGLEDLDQTTVEGKFHYLSARWYNEAFVSTMCETDGVMLYRTIKSIVGRKKKLHITGNLDKFVQISQKSQDGYWMCDPNCLVEVFCQIPVHTNAYVESDSRGSIIASACETDRSQAYRSRLKDIESSSELFTLDMATSMPYRASYPNYDKLPNKPFISSVHQDYVVMSINALRGL